MQRSSHTAALPKLSCHWRVSLHRWRFSSVQQGARMNEYKSMFSHLAGMFRFRGNSKLEVSNPRQVYCVICKKAFLCSGSITIVNYCMQVKHLGLPKYQKSHEKKQAAIDTYSGHSQSVQKEESLAQALTWWIISVSQPLTIVEDAILVKFSSQPWTLHTSHRQVMWWVLMWTPCSTQRSGGFNRNFPQPVPPVQQLTYGLQSLIMPTSASLRIGLTMGWVLHLEALQVGHVN